MKTIDFNVNYYIHVKLTDVGKKELKRQYDELNNKFKSILGPYNPPKEDNDGWSKFQMHSLMHKFGHMMVLGCLPPFETEIKFEIQ